MDNPSKQVAELGDLQVERVGNYLEGRKITICVTSGIAAMEVPKVARQLRRYGASVRILMSGKARDYFGTVMFEWASGNKVITGLTGQAEHISTDDDAVLVLPTTLNTIGEIAHGFASGLVTTYLASALGRGIPIVIVPAMHLTMFNNPIFQANLQKLSEFSNIHIVSSRFGEGKAKVADVQTIVATLTRAVSKFVNSKRGPSYKQVNNILITAGPTRGYIDPVRFITNMSSGQLGVMIADDLFLRGFGVILVYGPGTVVPPSYLNVVNVRTPQEMLDAVVGRISMGGYDGAIFAAAVTDFDPVTVSDKKVRSSDKLAVEFVPTPKIIKAIDELPAVRNCSGFVKVGFKLETAQNDQDLVRAGQEALERNNCQLVVVNDLKEIGPQGHRALLLDCYGRVELADSKQEITQKLGDYMVCMTNQEYYDVLH